MNRKSVGDVYVRASNSLSAEHQRVKMFSILPLLADSTNVIGVKAGTFSPSGSAGVNVYCELALMDGSVQKIMTDGSWKVTDRAAGNWTTVSFNDSSWRNSVVKPYPSIVVRPNFATGRGSWIER